MAKNHPMKKKIIIKVEIFLAVNCKKLRLNDSKHNQSINDHYYY